jgi:hypothetical protein
MNSRALLALPILLFAAAMSALAQSATSAAPASATKAAPAQPAQWKQSPIGSPDFFPLSVWCQQPRHAAEYQAIGINTYVDLWDGPTEKDLATLKKAGMKVFCDQNAVGLKHLADPTIIGWMHGDEPDNAQSKPKGQQGYDPPILPAKIIAAYKKILAADPTRPVMLNLGQAVARDAYYGRGTRTNHPEDYAEYMKGGDVVSFDIYPVNGDAAHPADINNKLWLVPFGVERLVNWGEGRKIVWNCIETTAFNGGHKPTPDQVKTEVWMSLIHGSHGIIYFCHVFKPTENDAGLLADHEMSAAVGQINKQITDLAPVLNSPTLNENLNLQNSSKDFPVDYCVKKYGGATYIFAVAMRNGPAKDEGFRVKGIGAGTLVDVLGENRKITIQSEGEFGDDFKGYEVHLYRIPAAK